MMQLLAQNAGRESGLQYGPALNSPNGVIFVGISAFAPNTYIRGCRPGPRRAAVSSTPFSPLNPLRGLRPTPVAPRGEAGGMVCVALLHILIGQQMVVVRFHRIFEYTPCLPARISQVLLAFLLFATTSTGLGGTCRRERMRVPLSTTIHSTVSPLVNSMA
jgi:hypothetical protein